MHTNLRLVAAVLILSLLTPSISRAGDVHSDFESAAADLVIARPLWFTATVLGSALFIVSLPISALSRSVDKTARTLVAKPAKATFTRPLGDFSSVD